MGRGLNLFGQKFELGNTKRAIRFNWSAKFGKSIYSVDFWLNSRLPQPSFTAVMVGKNINEIIMLVEELVNGNLNMPEIEEADKEVAEEVLELNKKEKPTVELGIDFSAELFKYRVDKRDHDLSEFCRITGIEQTGDMEVYNNYSYFSRSYMDSRMDEDQEEQVLDAAIGECVRGLLSIFDEYSSVLNLIPDRDCLTYMKKKPPYEVSRGIINDIEQDQYWDNWDAGKFKEMCDELGIDTYETEKLIRHNFTTGGKASRNILENFEDIDTEEFGGMVKAMIVAQKRHMDTDYDSIDKSKMSSDQVAELRRAMR